MTKLDTQNATPGLGGIVTLCHHRWMVPLIAEIGQLGGARVAVLRARLNVSGPSLSRTLAAARDADLVLPNPGYGHPLRPEYLLTPWGEVIARSCQELMELARASTWTDLVSRKWTLPVLAAIASGCHRYGDIARALPASTPRALSLALEELIRAGCVSRALTEGRPPQSRYGLDPRGRRLAEVALTIAATTHLE